MSEILILAAIVAPLALVPLVVISLQKPLNPDCSLNAGAEFWLFDEDLRAWQDSPFEEFRRVMLEQIEEAFSIRTLAPVDLDRVYQVTFPTFNWEVRQVYINVDLDEEGRG